MFAISIKPCISRVFLFAGVVVRDIGHGTQGDLELLQEDLEILQEDLSDEGFKVITLS